MLTVHNLIIGALYNYIVLTRALLVRYMLCTYLPFIRHAVHASTRIISHIRHARCNYASTYTKR